MDDIIDDNSSSSSNEEPKCSICFENLSYDDNGMHIMTTQCGHKFHTNCIMEYFINYKNKTCPLCRTPLYGSITPNDKLINSHNSICIKCTSGKYNNWLARSLNRNTSQLNEIEIWIRHFKCDNPNCGEKFHWDINNEPSFL